MKKYLPSSPTDWKFIGIFLLTLAIAILWFGFFRQRIK